MREITDVKPTPTTEFAILRHGIASIALEAPGGHADPNNPCYAVKREYKDYAVRILDAADKAYEAKAIENPEDGSEIPEPEEKDAQLVQVGWACRTLYTSNAKGPWLLGRRAIVHHPAVEVVAVYVKAEDGDGFLPAEPLDPFDTRWVRIDNKEATDD